LEDIVEPEVIRDSIVAEAEATAAHMLILGVLVMKARGIASVFIITPQGSMHAEVKGDWNIRLFIRGLV
jgi:hypothetical protein